MGLESNASIDPALLQSASERIPDTLEALGVFKAITTKDIQRMLSMEVMKQEAGCDTGTSCLAEIGGALGAAYVISGSLIAVDNAYLLQLQLLNIDRAVVESRFSREYSGNLAGLIALFETATKNLVRELLSAQSGELVVNVNEEGATIRLDGDIVGVSPMLPKRIGGGAHTLAIVKEGFITETRDVDIERDQITEVNVALRPSLEFLSKYQATVRKRRTLAWALIGVGGALAVGGAATLGAAAAEHQQLANDVAAYNQQTLRSPESETALRDRDRLVGTLDTIGLSTLIGGAVVGGLGAVLLLTGPDKDRYETSVSAEPKTASKIRLGLSWRGISIGGSF